MKKFQRREAEKTNEYNWPVPTTSLLCFLAANCIQRNAETYRASPTTEATGTGTIYI